MLGNFARMYRIGHSCSSIEYSYDEDAHLDLPRNIVEEWNGGGRRRRNEEALMCFALSPILCEGSGGGFGFNRRTKTMRCANPLPYSAMKRKAASLYPAPRLPRPIS